MVALSESSESETTASSQNRRISIRSTIAVVVCSLFLGCGESESLTIPKKPTSAPPLEATRIGVPPAQEADRANLDHSPEDPRRSDR